MPEISYDLPPIKAKYITVYQLWDKLIPVATVGFYDTPYVSLRTLCEMLNIDHEVEYERITGNNSLFTLYLSNIEDTNWISDVRPELGTTVWIELSMVPLWLAGLLPDSIKSVGSASTVSWMLHLIHAGLAETFGLASRQEILDWRKGLENDSAKTILMVTSD